jgi:hypothetical protein
MNESVSENPPKALVAMILPTRTRDADSSNVNVNVNVNQKGARDDCGGMDRWGGGMPFVPRSLFKRGGAPCPNKEFILSAEERGEKQAHDDGGGENFKFE